MLPPLSTADFALPLSLALLDLQETVWQIELTSSSSNIDTDCITKVNEFHATNARCLSRETYTCLQISRGLH